MTKETPPKRKRSKADSSSVTPPNRELVQQREEAAREWLINLVGPGHLKDFNRAIGIALRYHVTASAQGASTVVQSAGEYMEGDIYFGLDFIESFRSRGLENAAAGVVFHEGGHHSPVAKRFQDNMREDIGTQDLVPDAYRKTEQAANRFFDALAVVHNACADVVLEAYTGRMPYAYVKETYNALYADVLNDKTRKEKFPELPLPTQLIQLLVGEGRYPDLLDTPLETLVSQEVVSQEAYDAFLRLTDPANNVLKALQDMNVLGDPLATSPQVRERAYAKKFRAYRAIYTEWEELLKKEIEKRKQQKQQEKQGQEGQGQMQQGGRGRASGAPLTADEEEEIAKRILDEIIPEGQNPYGTTAPTKEEKEAWERAKKRVHDTYKPGAHSRQNVPSSPEVDQDVLDQQRREQERRRLADNFAKERDASRRRGLQDELGVREESIRQWEEIRQNYKVLIDWGVNELAEIFKEDRRLLRILFSKTGDVMHGMEFEFRRQRIIDPDPAVRERLKQQAYFLKTLIEYIVDTSGSMGKDKIKASAEMLVVLTEIFKRTKESLIDDNLLLEEDPSDQPLQIGATTYAAGGPRRVRKPDEELSMENQMHMLDKVAHIGGGTEGKQAIEERYEEMLAHDATLKMLVIYTDGYDNPKIAEVVKTIAKDDKVLFLVIAAGDRISNVRDLYERPAKEVRQGNDTNVFVLETQTVEKGVKAVVEELVKQVKLRQLQKG